jgi:type I restriction enzyme S subunit
MSELPKNWREVKLAEIVEVIRGASPRPKGDPRYFGGNIPWVMISDITREKGKFLTKTRDTVTEAGAEKSRYLEKGTLILSNSGTVCVPKIMGVRGCIHDGFVAFPHIDASVDQLFLYHYFDFVRDRVRRENKQGMVQVNLNTTIVKELDVPLPPLPEQRRIVARIEELFSRLDAGVVALRHAKAQLQRYRQSVLAAAVTGQLTQAWREQHPDTEPAEELLKRILNQRRKKWNGRRKYMEPIVPAVKGLPEIPTSWTWSSPAQLSAPEDYSLAIGPFGSNLKVSDYTDEGVPLVFVRHIRSNDYDLAQKFVSAEKASELKAHSIDPGDLLITKMGEPPGDAALYPAYRPHAIISADCIKLRLSELITSKSFFVNAINSQLVAKQIAPITRGVAQKKISLDRFRDIALPLPPLAEQHQIVAEVEARTTVINHLEAELDRQITRSNRLRQSTLISAFSGRF